jgi:hypothetical protein
MLVHYHDNNPNLLVAKIYNLTDVLMAKVKKPESPR